MYLKEQVSFMLARERTRIDQRHNDKVSAVKDACQTGHQIIPELHANKQIMLIILSPAPNNERAPSRFCQYPGMASPKPSMSLST